MQVYCYDCGKSATLSLARWNCPCGGAWEPELQAPFDASKILITDYSIWRYGKLLGLDVSAPYQPMGVGWTPLVPITLFEQQILLKLEYLMPTGSFKDRGVNAMVNQLVFMGVSAMVEDSSGNAGASLAAHGARFGVHTQIYVPDYASRFKQYQIGIYGVELVRIKGTRKDTEQAAQSAVEGDRTYASHAYQPAYLAGQTTTAFEVWEQLGRKAPTTIICPVAQGGQFLGLWFGFKRLMAAGLVDRLPRMIAVQSAQVAPLFHAWEQGLDDVPSVDPLGPTVAEGVSISYPVRGKRLLQAVRETNGLVFAIQDDEIMAGQQLMAHMGYYIEPTSALVVAGLKHLKNDLTSEEIVLMPLTGSGLKGEPKSSNK